jgi:lipid-A-disaccharide synthase
MREPFGRLGPLKEWGVGSSDNLSVLMVAGEASADLHGAALLRELKKINPALTCFGVGGSHLSAEGMEVVIPAARLNIVGVTNLVGKLSDVWRSFSQLCQLARGRRPAFAVLLDLPDFNLRLAKKLKAMQIPVIYYISPQVWAWRRYRVKQIRKFVDRMVVVFPFEKAFYESQGVDVEFVGHPLLESIRSRSSYRSAEEVKAAPRIALLPGSRKTEIAFHLPLLKEIVSDLLRRYPNATFRLPLASTIPREQIQAAAFGAEVSLEDGGAREILAWADLAIVASGTATLETALVGTPFCLIYKVSRSNAWLYRAIVRWRGFIGLPNLLLGRGVAKEFFQKEATPTKISAECIHLIEDADYHRDMARDLLSCRTILGSEGASERAARHILQVISNPGMVGRGKTVASVT